MDPGLPVASETKAALKVDKNGLPLIPQPTDSPLDPLNYPNWLRYTILAEISLLGFILGLCGATLADPVIDQLSQEFNVPLNLATYQSSALFVVGSFIALVVVPTANAYGHRLVLLSCTALAVVFLVVAANSTSFGMLIALRGLTSFSLLGVVVIPNLFFVHERGRAMGFFTLVALNGVHLAPMIGGDVAFRLGWRWTLWIGAILTGTMLVIMIFLLPDTLFRRPGQDLTLGAFLEHDMSTKHTRKPHQPPPMQLSTYLRCLRLVDQERRPSNGVRVLSILTQPFKMFRYPSVIIPVVYYSVITSFASLGPLVVGPVQYTKNYHFGALQDRLAMGPSLVIGSVIGELASGPLTDFLVERARKRALEGGKPAQPEIRLQGIYPAAIIVPMGLDLLLSDGFTVHYMGSFTAPCIAIGDFNIVQIATSVCLTYVCCDCYPAYSGGLGQSFSFIKSLFTLALTFYEVPVGQRIGYHWAFTVYAAICTLLLLPVAALMFKGAQWREKADTLGSS
ncbi:MFS general substrate transporter [Macrolepiota fuliginosa MF-IS2]|uniref:MFS general substrate transporter n=1 Tax=Macrolepiota fuliginosa MF-IS2 TaxID=1400762 RepID=A0A9P5X3K6_9AGAR|nr:MFS general substrate transporter [Macrolepiota fuliginosa MF-IS2]